MFFPASLSNPSDTPGLAKCHALASEPPLPTAVQEPPF